MAFSFIWVVALAVCCSPVKVVLGVLGVSAVTWNRKDVQVQGCKAMWESELRRNSGFGCVAIPQWRDRRISHKRSGCRELAHMSYPSHREMRVAGRPPEVATRRQTSRDVATGLKRAIYATATEFSRAGSGTGTDDPLRVFRMPVPSGVTAPEFSRAVSGTGADDALRVFRMGACPPEPCGGLAHLGGSRQHVHLRRSCQTCPTRQTCRTGPTEQDIAPKRL